MTSTRTPSVLYVTGRRTMVVRQVAILSAALQGHRWEDLTEREKVKMQEAADEVVRGWVVDGVVVEFMGEYRERA